MIESDGNELVFVAIDGHRMAVRRTANGVQDTSFSVVVPGKTLNEISKIIEPEDDEMEIFTSKNQILFKIDNCKNYVQTFRRGGI